MKLYLAPGACSLATHIVLHEADRDFERVTVDLRNRRTEDGRDYNTINPKGYVPALELDDGRVLTENVAVLDWLAHQHGALAVQGEHAHTRQLEMLAFISTEIHKQFGRVFKASGDAEKDAALAKIDERLAFIAGKLEGDYLFGDRFTVADAYLYVTLRWAAGKGRKLPPALDPYKQRIEQRPAVKLSLQHEGLDQAKA